MKLIMENWRTFITENVQNVGLAVSKDQDKEMLVSLSGASDENIRDWGDMLIISFDSPDAAEAFMSNPEVGAFDPRNISQENLDAVESGAGEMGIEPGEGDIRHTRADGQKYKSKLEPAEKEEPSVEWDFGGDRGIELVTPSHAEFLSKHREIAKNINRIQTDQEARLDYRSKYGTRQEKPPRVTVPEAPAVSYADTISSTPPGPQKKLKDYSKIKKTEPYSVA